MIETVGRLNGRLKKDIAARSTFFANQPAQFRMAAEVAASIASAAMKK